MEEAGQCDRRTDGNDCRSDGFPNRHGSQEWPDQPDY
jgi:hypothetical protein